MGNENSNGKSPSFRPSPQESTRYSDKKMEPNTSHYQTDNDEQPSFGNHGNNSHFGFSSDSPQNKTSKSSVKTPALESSEREGFIERFRKSFEKPQLVKI
jgi:hypothetical protein